MFFWKWIYKYINNKHLKRTLIIILSVLICIIGVSRIYLGVHYTSDVLGGFLISFAYLIIYIELVNKFVLEKNKDDVDCYIDEEIRETTYNALEYCKIRVKKLDIMIRETALFKETMDSIIDGLNVLDKNLLVARYIKRQDWDTMATFWPCEISSRQIQRIHRSLLNDILQKYRELSSKKQK